MRSQHGGELARFADISLGSANELDYQLVLAKELGYLAPELFEVLLNKNASVRRMLSRLAAAAGS